MFLLKASGSDCHLIWYETFAVKKELKKKHLVQLIIGIQESYGISVE